ncbi:hypothetical protein BDR03DRAFT_986555 [Suillus americanus]|nr:hypothetical protein BDR03DRAFT_986555 [Suillus americanus]
MGATMQFALALAVSHLPLCSCALTPVGQGYDSITLPGYVMSVKIKEEHDDINIHTSHIKYELSLSALVAREHPVTTSVRLVRLTEDQVQRHSACDENRVDILLSVVYLMHAGSQSCGSVAHVNNEQLALTPMASLILASFENNPL